MLLVVTGLEAEARRLSAPGVRIAAIAGDASRLPASPSPGAPGAVTAVISIGLCGALEPGLQPGDWVVGARAVDAAGGLIGAADAAWRDALAAILPGARAGDVAASPVVVGRPEDKRALAAASGAIAVDMESGHAARFAQGCGAPFAIARVVSDASDQALPAAAAAGMGADGRIDVLAVLRGLARRPADLPALLRLARGSGTAFRALGRGRDLLGPGFGRPDLGQLPLDVV